MTWNTIMGLFSSIALFLPLVAILALRLISYKTFYALFIYYTLAFSYNLFTEGYIHVSPQYIEAFGLSNNLLDVPLMLTFLHYFSTSAIFSKRLKWATAAYILFEIITVSIMGFNVKAITVILAPGLAMVTGLYLMLFIRHTKITIMYKKGTGKSLISAALLFAYGCYSILYLLYYIYDSQNVQDSFLIYFLATILSSILLTLGIISEYRRIRTLHELKITRKELSALYSKEAKTIVMTKRVKLDFDSENSFGK